MGPILIFDKSALQSFSVDESVWLDNYFLTNITPLFYVETLADLSLTSTSRPPEDIISELVAKTPTALANIHHGRLVLGNLLGQSVETEHGRPIVDRGVTKRAPDGKIGVYFDESPEEIALKRWHKKEYHEIEREFAKEWRRTLAVINFDLAIGIAKNILPEKQNLTTLESIKSFIDKLFHTSSRELLILLFEFLGIPSNLHKTILTRWEKESRPTLDEFAPYAAYVLKIDLFFYISALKGLIAKERTTNKVDLAYLYYLPFCHIFVSGDKLHARTAPLFIRQDQTFISASDFKEGLGKINEYYINFEDEIAEVGVMKYAPYPPLEIETSIHRLWDIHCPSWRQSASLALPKIQFSPTDSDKHLVESINKQHQESEVIDSKSIESMDDADHVTIKHMVSVQRGRWRILPKGIENKKTSQ